MNTSVCVLALDLGTSGCKGLLLDDRGSVLATADAAYSTYYPGRGMREQNPEAWWEAAAACTGAVLRESRTPGCAVRCIGLSGHSLGVVPLDAHGHLLANRVPIWSDERALLEAEAFFRDVDEERWYGETGNGFPRHLYAAFKMAWYRNHWPDLFERAAVFLGTKDYLNFRLTGASLTDPSYASGSGVYSLERHRYVDEYVEACGIPRKKLPEVLPAATIIGPLTADAASGLGLTTATQVVAGGVDNACMALGARSYQTGQWYMALGSSSWIAVSGPRPLIDFTERPYVFAHVVPDQFTSALSTFSAGTTLQWVVDTLRPAVAATSGTKDGYEAAFELARQSPVGANGLLFDPTLAGSTVTAGAMRHRKGALLGIQLRHTAADILRATLEGIGFELRSVLNRLRRLAPLDDQMLLVGGGARSPLWRQILADILGVRVHKTSMDHQAAALGAGTLAAVGCGLWEDFIRVDQAHQTESIVAPVPRSQKDYECLYRLFLEAAAARCEVDGSLDELTTRDMS